MALSERPKRFLLFVYEDYYPLGGMNDCRGSFDTKDQAFDAIPKMSFDDNFQVYDTKTGRQWSNAYSD